MGDVAWVDDVFGNVLYCTEGACYAFGTWYLCCKRMNK